ncbi:DUF4432 family protein [Paracoccus sp. DMF-8]|uniref:DUF4432 family protein n=1 Tax=Paracoccus sp. DMF-8 TaxID=3019445 RepID=UPI0023E837D4|nr:DUF4432 family protein [Paracoccus sp. DMF-8]MDF3606786.1 DUF4432 family protein [Paracoccus sp. DMF-8]
MVVSIPLFRELAADAPRIIATAQGMSASLRRYPTGIESLTIATPRGWVELLPWLGQMVWDAEFDGVRLTMGSPFEAPRPARVIVETYGCLAFHSGLLRNGCPGPGDDHLLHGEMACATMDSARLEIGTDGQGPFMRLAGHVDHIMGFGPNYRAEPSVMVRPDATVFDMAMRVTNRSFAPMDLMYMAHANFGFVPGGRIHQAAPWTPDRTRVRTAIPAHVPATPAYRAFLDELAARPDAMERLDQPERYDPEQVFYIEQPATDAAGLTHLMLERPEGDGFVMTYAPAEFPKLVRWVLVNGDAQVAAFALPSTCYPEGFSAEQAAGRVRQLAPAETAAFSVSMGYADRAAAQDIAARIAGLNKG